MRAGHVDRGPEPISERIGRRCAAWTVLGIRDRVAPLPRHRRPGHRTERVLDVGNNPPAPSAPPRAGRPDRPRRLDAALGRVSAPTSSSAMSSWPATTGASATPRLGVRATGTVDRGVDEQVRHRVARVRLERAAASRGRAAGACATGRARRARSTRSVRISRVPPLERAHLLVDVARVAGLVGRLDVDDEEVAVVARARRAPRRAGRRSRCRSRRSRRARRRTAMSVSTPSPRTRSTAVVRPAEQP